LGVEEPSAKLQKLDNDKKARVKRQYVWQHKKSTKVVPLWKLKINISGLNNLQQWTWQNVLWILPCSSDCGK
jgi:hypothetical protein